MPANTAVEWKVEGLDKVIDKLYTLPAKLQRKGVRNAVKRGALILKKAVIANFAALQIDDPETPENIGKNVSIQFASRMSRREGGAVYRVGVRGGAKKYVDDKGNRRKGRVGKTYKVGGSKGNPGGDTFYWRFIELGAPGAGIAARPFMTTAMTQNAENITTEVAKAMSEEIDKVIKSQ